MPINPPMLENPAAPYSQEAEEAVLGSILVNGKALVEVMPLVNAEDFFMLRHQYIYQAMQRLFEAHKPIDTLTLGEELANYGQLDDVGGRVYLIRLINNTPTSTYAAVYAEIVQRAAVRRKLLAAADNIRVLALDEEKNIEAVLSGVTSTLEVAMNTRSADTEKMIWAAVSTYYDEFEARALNGAVPGLPSGFRDLDALLGGYQRGDFIITAGRPGMGKSALILTIAMHMAQRGKRVAFYTLEMPTAQLVERMISMTGGINVQKLRAGKLSPAEQSRVVDIMAVVSELPMMIDDGSSLTPSQLARRLRRMQYHFGLDAVFVDYLQLMGSDAKLGSRELEISHISRSLKAIAKDLNIPVFAAAQLNRDLEKRRNKRPQLSDLRESGSLEQDTDIVQFIYRDEVYNDDTEYPGQAELIVEKHRNGATGTVSLYFEKSLTKFMDSSVSRIDLHDL